MFYTAPWITLFFNDAGIYQLEEIRIKAGETPDELVE